ncbi:hypothetical protein CB0940_11988 [Cercospora beticola]|uniref:Uncharacterized protein n=1 Tax=Cercospora beticola TaxID=122368 RepID=A0A2G5IEM3_CERBT|nr:hypothetical protein CB0940_11988 [Cercospora beticola]PIB03225.1 hypothetical protein CB0940_11988 [Cercospora beticola]WPB04369.1 hypothetical protein RHO25_009015 [Cercospora beticola]CAK1356806.1 unnamed protein product [Cercospora beticola]
MHSLTPKELEDQLAASEARLKRLESDAAEERAAIDALKQLKQPSTPLGLFEKLPREMRGKIWGYCVAPGKVFLSEHACTYDTRFDDYSDYGKPHLSLLAVSKSVRPEAAEMLFKQNQFIFTDVSPRGRWILHDDSLRDDHYGEDPDARKDPLGRLARTHLRSASIAFDMRSPRYENVIRDAGWLRDPGLLRPRPWSTLTEQQKITRAHEFAIVQTYSGIMAELEILLYKCDSLTTLELDFTNSYCPIGCCRVVSYLTDLLVRHDHWWPERLRVLGLKNQEERDRFMISVCAVSRDDKIEVVFEKFVAPKKSFLEYNCLHEERLDKELEQEHFEILNGTVSE